MRNKNSILNTLGTLVKWFFLIEALDIVILIFYFIIVKSDIVVIGYLVPFAVFSGLLTFAGHKLEKLGKKEIEQPLIKQPVVELDYKPVTSRTRKVTNGEFIYVFKNRVDLFADGKEELAYQELPWNFQIVANLGKHILERRMMLIMKYFRRR